MAGARHGMCELTARHGRGTAWARHGHAMLLCESALMETVVKKIYIYFYEYIYIYFFINSGLGHPLPVIQLGVLLGID